MLLDGRFSAANCAFLHVVHPVIGRFPSAALMRAWAGGGDGFGLCFIVADGAYLMPGTGFSGSCFFIDDPVAIGVGGLINVGCFTVCTVFPMVGLIRCPVGKGGMVTGVKPTVWFAADFALFLCVAGGSAACVGGFLYNRTAIVASLPMAGLIKFPVGKGGMVTGARFAIRFAADFAPFRFGAGGGAAGVSGFLYDRAASCTLFHVMHSVIGRFPSSAALMCAGDGRDGGRFFVVANAARAML